jgi:hypothetical protein
MATLPKSRSSKQSAKKEFIVSNRKIGVADILEAAERKTIPMEVSIEERYQLISKAAYFRAEQRSFAPGHELEDWLEAEAEIERNLPQIPMDNLIKNV